MPRLDFVPVGLTARWPSKRWLEFLEGPSAGPFWGAHLGHADASAALYVCAYPRARYDAVMRRPGEDPLREVPAQAISLAGWEAAFAVAADCYVVAYSYGAPLEGIVLSPVQDPRPYGFTLEDAVQPAAAPDVAGNEASEELHADLAGILAD